MPALKYVFIGVLICIYMGPILYVFSKRNFAETRARSPMTTTLCIFLIMLDSIFNTWIFSIETKDQEKAHLKCLLGVWVTMIIMCPILVTMYLRIYRVKRVFELYEKFLDKMMVRSGSIFSSYGYMSSQLALRKSLGRTFDNSKSMTNYNE